VNDGKQLGLHMRGQLHNEQAKEDKTLGHNTDPTSARQVRGGWLISATLDNSAAVCRRVMMQVGCS
jgi:hypothetical protein